MQTFFEVITHCNNYGFAALVEYKHCHGAVNFAPPA